VNRQVAIYEYLYIAFNLRTGRRSVSTVTIRIYLEKLADRIRYCFSNRRSPPTSGSSSDSRDG
jgi:hypothetical protein